MKLIRIKTHDVPAGKVTYECTEGSIPKAVPFKRNQPDIINVIMPTEVFYLEMPDRAQKIVPGEHVLIEDANGRLSIMAHVQLDRSFVPYEEPKPATS